MIHLRDMQPQEFAGYAEYFLKDYAIEIASNYGLAATAAQARAERELAADLGQGTATPGQALLCIVDDQDALLGYAWCRPDADSSSVFVLDFHILPAHQGKGLGKQALALLEAHFARAGFSEIRLRVAADNARARHVYDVGGFRVTGINMAKPLKPL